jgi:DNA-binding transcriptional ArsR family regulator
MSAMPAPSSCLLPLFRSDQQARLLAEVYFGEPATGSDLARRTGIAQPTVSRELARLADARLVVTTRVGNAKIVHPNPDLPYAGSLRQLVAYAAGAPHIVRAQYESVDDIDEVFIHGSWAARYRGENGPPPHDLDVVIVSSTHTRFTLAAHRAAIEEATGIPVDQIVLPPDHERLSELRSNSVTVIERQHIHA